MDFVHFLLFIRVFRLYFFLQLFATFLPESTSAFFGYLTDQTFFTFSTLFENFEAKYAQKGS
jgi:hypothetical protein